VTGNPTALALGGCQDTTYFLDLTKTERPSAFERGVELFEAGVPRRVPAHVVFELFYGVEAAGAGEQRRVRNALMGYPIVPADDRIARLAGRLHARHRTAGVDLGDCYMRNRRNTTAFRPWIRAVT
jgi:predicted nucleic acid-binding protein